MKRFIENDENLVLTDPFTGAPVASAAPVFPGQVVFPTPAAGDTGLVADPAASPIAEDFDPMAIDADGGAGNESDILEPELYEDEMDPMAVAPELGDFPADPTVTSDIPVVLDDTDEDIYENDDLLGESKIFVAKKAFHLPESHNLVVCRGDKISFVGKAKTSNVKFAESTFSRALGKLTESRKGKIVTEGAAEDKVALIGNSCLFEVARDWRLPGTNLILEAGDIYQVIGCKPLREADDSKDDKKDDKDGEKDSKDNLAPPFEKKDKDDDEDKDAKKDDSSKKESRLHESRLNRHGVTFGVADRY